MIHHHNDVVDFHEKFGLTYRGMARWLPVDLALFRSGFLLEEITEWEAASWKCDRAGQLDGLVDLAYVALGSLYLHGLPPRPMSMLPVHVPDGLTETRWSGAPRDLRTDEFEQILGALCAPARVYERTAADPLGVETAREVLHELAFRAYAAARLQGFDFDLAWRRVHEANMKKERGPSDRSGSHDVIKPTGWCAPDLSDLVR